MSTSELISEVMFDTSISSSIRSDTPSQNSQYSNKAVCHVSVCANGPHVSTLIDGNDLFVMCVCETFKLSCGRV